VKNGFTRCSVRTRIEHTTRRKTFFEQVNEATIKTGENTLRASVLINGGAAVSVLAFIGGLASKELIGVSQLASVANSLAVFAGGVAVAVAGMGLSYVANYLTGAHAASQKKLWEHPWVTPGDHTESLAAWKTFVQVLAIGAGVVSILLFCGGVYSVRSAIEHLPPSARVAEAITSAPTSSAVFGLLPNIAAMTPGRWINLAAAAIGAIGAIVLFNGSFAYEASLSGTAEL
jgi:hypothetical protein